MTKVIVAAVAAITLVAGAPRAAVTTSHSATTPGSRLVGRWSRIKTCQELVDALRKAGLGSTAPAAVGDFFPNSTPQQLARKSDLCSGAAPQVHSHFFTSHGKFGSLDQNGQQVDDGRY